MADFSFLQNPLTKNWVILAPRRAKRPDIAYGIEPICPFCVGREGEEKELYRVEAPRVISVDDSSSLASELTAPSVRSDIHSSRESKSSPSFRIAQRSVPYSSAQDSWTVRVLNNKFPFAPIHEVIIHSPSHDQNFDKLPKEQNELILKTYRQRFQTHQAKGHVYIFHNHGEQGGESLPHPHTQLAVIPPTIELNIPRLDPSSSVGFGPKQEPQEHVETSHFYLFCPKTSQWPDEVWVAPKKRGRLFSEASDEEISDLAHTLQRLIQIFDIRHGNEFPFNFYIYPGGDWYLRLIPRLKTLGGFEIGTNIFINTQNPKETIQFIKTHFETPDEERIKREHQAGYGRTV